MSRCPECMRKQPCSCGFKSEKKISEVIPLPTSVEKDDRHLCKFRVSDKDGFLISNNHHWEEAKAISRALNAHDELNEKIIGFTKSKACKCSKCTGLPDAESFYEDDKA